MGEAWGSAKLWEGSGGEGVVRWGRGGRNPPPGGRLSGEGWGLLGWVFK